jgi:lipid-A-disaccharide synthase
MIGQSKKIFIIAGEASGDFIGGKLIDALQKHLPYLEIHGVGGKQMELRGVRSILPINKLSVMGFFEIIPHIFTLKNFIRHAVKNILKDQPDLIITIDSPGFNFRVVEALRKAKLNTKYLHIVAPSVWAYNPERAKKVADLYDMLLTLLPFEPPLFTRYGLKTEYIGHPIFEQNYNRNIGYFRTKYNIPEEARIICVTPGSRTGEIKKHMKIFVKALKLLQTRYNIFAIFPLNKMEDAMLVESYMGDAVPHICIFDEERIDGYFIADVAIAKSGTNTLEISACETPLIIAYKVHFLTYLYIKSKALIKYISLINILANKEIIPEFIQNNCNAAALATATAKYLESDRLSEVQVQETSKIMHQIGFKAHTKASERAAEIIITKFLR